MQLINLTPHVINIISGANSMSIPPSGQVARVKTFDRLINTFNGIDVYDTSFGVEGLPPRKPNTMYIVSAVVKAAVDRDDVLSPES